MAADMEVVTLILEENKERLEKTASVLKNEYTSIRAGRANPHVLDKVQVDYYGQPSPINQVGNISVQDGRCLVIAPWDKSMLKNIEKAILVSNIGLTPTNDGTVIRLVFPELTEERRKELVKIIRKKGEEAKVAVRSIRRDANDQITKAKKDSEITEDDQKSLEEEAQKLTDAKIKDIDKIIADKEKEILEV